MGAVKRKLTEAQEQERVQQFEALGRALLDLEAGIPVPGYHLLLLFGRVYLVEEPPPESGGPAQRVYPLQETGHMLPDQLQAYFDNRGQYNMVDAWTRANVTHARHRRCLVFHFVDREGHPTRAPQPQILT